MSQISGTYDDGKVVLDSHVNWSSGARVFVVSPDEPLGLNEEDWPTTQEGIAELLERIDSVEPLELTSDDEVEIRAARDAVRLKSIEAK